MAADRKLRVGVIGTGAFAEACHLPGLLSHPQAEVVAVCGRNPERARAVAERFGVPEVCADAAALCAHETIDAVTICTPNAAHREPARLAFAGGKHVFCEKPLGLTVAEAEEMLAAAEASGRLHQVAFTYRYLHGVAELRRRVRAGDVGEPFLLRVHHEYWNGPGAAIGWRELRAPAGGGVLYDMGSHLFDLASFVMGSAIVAVQANVQHLPRPGVETDDIALAWFRFASGVRGHWHASRITPPRGENYVQVVGREGALEALLSRGRQDALRIARPGAGWADLPLPEEAMDGQSHALGRMMRSFVDACLQGRLGEEDASFHDGVAAQRAIAAAEASVPPLL
jgi:predicted dehydrogenase